MIILVFCLLVGLNLSRKRNVYGGLNANRCLITNVGAKGTQPTFPFTGTIEIEVFSPNGSRVDTSTITRCVRDNQEESDDCLEAYKRFVNMTDMVVCQKRYNPRVKKASYQLIFKKDYTKKVDVVTSPPENVTESSKVKEEEVKVPEIIPPTVDLGKYENLKKRVRDLEEEIKKTRATVTTISDTGDNTETEWNITKKGLEENIEKLKQEKKEAIEKANIAEDRVEELEAELTKLRKEMAPLLKKIEDLESRNKELEAAMATIKAEESRRFNTSVIVLIYGKEVPSQYLRLGILITGTFFVCLFICAALLTCGEIFGFVGFVWSPTNEVFTNEVLGKIHKMKKDLSDQIDDDDEFEMTTDIEKKAKDVLDTKGARTMPLHMSSIRLCITNGNTEVLEKMLFMNKKKTPLKRMNRRSILIDEDSLWFQILRESVEAKKLKIVEWLCSDADASKLLKNAIGFLDLHEVLVYCAQNGLNEIFSVLTEFGNEHFGEEEEEDSDRFNISFRGNEILDVCLKNCCEEGHVEILKILRNKFDLLESGSSADENQKKMMRTKLGSAVPAAVH